MFRIESVQSAVPWTCSVSTALEVEDVVFADVITSRVDDVMSLVIACAAVYVVIGLLLKINFHTPTYSTLRCFQ